MSFGFIFLVFSIAFASFTYLILYSFVCNFGLVFPFTTELIFDERFISLFNNPIFAFSVIFVFFLIFFITLSFNFYHRYSSYFLDDMEK